MSLEDYKEWTRTTAVYPGADGNDVALSAQAVEVLYLGLGLGEFGEVQGKIKKMLRDSNGQITPEVRRAILDELSDGLWYFARLLDALNSDFHEVATINKAKLTDRKDRGVLKGSGDYR